MDVMVIVTSCMMTMLHVYCVDILLKGIGLSHVMLIGPKRGHAQTTFDITMTKAFRDLLA